MIQDDVRNMDAQEYAMSGLETQDQQEAEAAAEAEFQCLVCWLFPNACSRPEHDCDLHRVSIEAMRFASDQGIDPGYEAARADH